jgi:hypothetical protein
VLQEEHVSVRSTLVAIILASLRPLPAVCQQNPTGSASQPKQTIASDTATLPEWLPFPIPRPLYAKWRKYGEWDYKQQGFKYRDATQFNFGATASAAGLDEKSIRALVNATRPTSHDVDRLVNRELQAAFSRDAAALDTLRTMAEADPHVIRIATDFTQLDSCYQIAARAHRSDRGTLE